MPDSKTHAILGIIAFFVSIAIANYLGYSATPELMVLGFFLSVLASEFADIDSGHTKIAELIYAMLLVGALIGLAAFHFYQNQNGFYLATIFIFVLLAIVLFLKHRGVTHSYPFAVLSSLPFFYLNPFFGIVWFVGYAGAHLLPDSFSGKGKYI